MTTAEMITGFFCLVGIAGAGLAAWFAFLVFGGKSKLVKFKPKAWPKITSKQAQTRIELIKKFPRQLSK